MAIGRKEHGQVRVARPRQGQRHARPRQARRRRVAARQLQDSRLSGWARKSVSHRGGQSSIPKKYLVTLLWNKNRLSQPLEHIRRPCAGALLVHIRAVDEKDIRLFGMGGKRRQNRREREKESREAAANLPRAYDCSRRTARSCVPRDRPTANLVVRVRHSLHSSCLRGVLRHHSSDCLRQRPSVGGYATQFALRAHPT